MPGRRLIVVDGTISKEFTIQSSQKMIRGSNLSSTHSMQQNSYGKCHRTAIKSQEIVVLKHFLVAWLTRGLFTMGLPLLNEIGGMHKGP